MAKSSLTAPKPIETNQVSVAPSSKADRIRALALSAFAFGVCFAVWTLFGIIGVRIQSELGLNQTEFGLLVATPVLTGSISRPFLGIWAYRFGGRIVYTLVMRPAIPSTPS